MKISLWHLYERLLEYAPTANITEGRCVIENVRIFSPSNQLYFTDYVYLVSLDAEYGWKTPQETVILFHRNDMIILHHATFHEVMNKIMDIFDQFRNIEQKLKQACQSDRPYEDMLTILYDYYHLPIVITNNNLKILAATPVIGAIMNGWDIIFETHYMPVTFFSVFNNEENNRRFITCKHPFLMDPVNQNAAKYYRKLFVIPFEINQLSAGKVLINLFEDTISPGSLLMGEIFASWFSKISHAGDDTYRMSDYFENAVRDNYYSEAEMQVIYNMRRWKPETLFSLCVLQDSRRLLTIPELRWCSGILEMNIQGSLAITVENRILLMIPEQNPSLDRMLTHVFQKNIPGFSFQCGSSLPFRKFKNFQTYYLQALYALNQLHNSGRRFLRFQDCGFHGVCSYLADHFSWELFYPPELLELERLDRLHQTDYCRTFYSYLQNGQQLQLTADHLHIHPNTLKYRLRKIFTVLDYQPEDLEKRHYYLLCMQLKFQSPVFR